MNKQLLIILSFFLFQNCHNKNEIELTQDYLNGNWYFIDSICNPDPDLYGYNYIEVNFNDSISTWYSTYLLLGPFYHPYEISNDSLKFENNLGIEIEIIDSISFTYKEACDKGDTVIRKLKKLQDHKYPLKEFYSQNELDSFSHQNFIRRYEILKNENLIKKNPDSLLFIKDTIINGYSVEIELRNAYLLKERKNTLRIDIQGISKNDIVISTNSTYAKVEQEQISKDFIIIPTMTSKKVSIKIMTRKNGELVNIGNFELDTE